MLVERVTKIIVKDKKRTNNLSKQPGGSTVEVYYKDYPIVHVYTNVKYPQAFIKKIGESTQKNSILKTIIVTEK